VRSARSMSCNTWEKGRIQQRLSAFHPPSQSSARTVSMIALALRRPRSQAVLPSQIGQRAFYECFVLSSVCVPASVASLVGGWFGDSERYSPQRRNLPALFFERGSPGIAQKHFTTVNGCYPFAFLRRFPSSPRTASRIAAVSLP
jgi:hypothetical protein